MRFSGETGAALHQALKDAADTITRMPATYMTFPNGGPVLPVQRIARVPRPHTIRLDEAYLASFGELYVPRHLWRALRRFDVWIEPALIAEWMRLMKVYASRQGRVLDNAQLATAMTWSEPTRDVRLAREQAIRLIGTGSLFCVWSGRKLMQGSLDADHCFPWSAWPCDDLWNVMPAHRRVNQQEKRDRLPSDPLLRAAQERIIIWWQAAWAAAPILAERFALEAAASLPGLQRPASLDEVFSAARLQRMRLQHDQQVPEWVGPHP